MVFSGKVVLLDIPSFRRLFDAAVESTSESEPWQIKGSYKVAILGPLGGTKSHRPSCFWLLGGICTLHALSPTQERLKDA